MFIVHYGTYIQFNIGTCTIQMMEMVENWDLLNVIVQRMDSRRLVGGV
jgi:hypothetical protein